MDISPAKRTGPDTHAALQPSAGKLQPNKNVKGQVSIEHTGPDTHASQHQSAGKLKLDPHRPRPSTSGCTGPDIAAKHQSTGKPTSDRHQADSLPSDSDPAVSRHQSSSKLSTDQLSSNRPRTDRPGSSFLAGSESPPLHHTGRRDSISSLESQAESEISDRPLVELFVEEGELSEDQEFGETEQPTSEEQTYRVTMSGIRSFMGWTRVPDMDSSNPLDDNPFAGPKAPVPNKVSVQMPMEEWLCKKLSKLNLTLRRNLTLIEGYPSRTAEAGHLPMDQFLKPARSQTSSCTSFRTESYSLAPLMVTGQPLLINWEIHPLISARTKISHVSLIVSIETEPKVGGESLPGTYPWFCTS